MRLNPYHPERIWSHLGRAHFAAGPYAEAVGPLKRLSPPDHTQHAPRAACYPQLETPAEAKSHIDQALKRQPAFTISAYAKTLHYKRQEDLALHRDSLLKAGLPA